MSIRLRLSLIYTAVLAAALLLFGVLSYASVARDGIAVMTNTLSIKARRMATSPGFNPAAVQAPAALYAGPEVYVQTVDGAGAVLDRTPNLAARTLPLLPAPGAGPQAQVGVMAGERMLIYSYPLESAPGARLLLASPLAARDRSLARFRQTLILGSAVILAAAFGLGWGLAGLGLRPIRRMTAAAQTIGDRRDFAQRVPSPATHDEVSRLGATFNDMLAALEAAYRRLETTLAAQQRFVQDASHELRTPLTTIRGNLALLQRTPPPPPAAAAEIWTDLVDETDRLIRLVNDLLALARSDAGPRLVCAPTPLRPLVEHTVRQAQRLDPARPVRWDAAPAPAVLADADALQQVLLILVDNVHKHTPPHAPLALEAAVDGEQVVLRVCDGGPGIAPEHLPHLFDRFYRPDPARQAGGVGLGLAIAKQLVEAQGGDLAATSTLGQGSTFTITLPAAPSVQP